MAINKVIGTSVAAKQRLGKCKWTHTGDQLRTKGLSTNDFLENPVKQMRSWM